jgi:hypothetical protein
MSAKPFTPEGNTVLITAAVTAPTPVVVASNTLGGNQYRVINNGSVTAFLGFGANAATATTNAVAPTSGSGNSTFSIPLLAGTDEILSFLPNMYATAVTLSSTATIYITPGDGT